MNQVSTTPRHMFSYVHGDDTVCITTTAETLSELVEKFEDYLKACGFHFEGRTLDFVDDDTNERIESLLNEAMVPKPYPATGYVPPVTDDLNPSEDKGTAP